MDRVARDVYRAIHMGAWIKIEYVNRDEARTRYWIGIKKLDPRRRKLTVDGLNVATRQISELTLRYDAIQSTQIVEGTYYETSPALIRDIREHPARYAEIFKNTANLKILDYYIDCSKLDVSPEQVRWGLIEELDIQTLGQGPYHLSPDQYTAIIKRFNLRKASKKARHKGWMISLCMNVASMRVHDKLIVLAYREVLLDVINRTLRQSPDITLCSEFTVDGDQYHIDRFLSEEHRDLLRDFAANEDEIKRVLDEENPEFGGVDDMPYLMAIRRAFTVGLERDYSAILKMMEDDLAPAPLKAFFGSLIQKPQSMKALPLAFYNAQINVDQLNAIYSGIRNPLLYVQGPPGTGKTSTILNLVVSLFFNNRTVLISSYNNHPMDEIFQKLQSLQAGDAPIPFPVVRLGNNEKVQESIRHIRKLYTMAQNAPEEFLAESVLPQTELVRSMLSQENRKDMQKLAQLLKRHEKRQEDLERRDMLQTTISSANNMLLLADMQGRQLKKLNRRIKARETISEEEIRNLVGTGEEQVMRIILSASLRKLMMLERPKYKELHRIIFDTSVEAAEAAVLLSDYLSHEENMRSFLRIFPVVITTNSSAYRLGPPSQHFDMTIIDEASQCSTATSLLAVVRSRQLILVGDPQQLKPVVQLDPGANQRLREKYHVPAEYDYIERSAYETFLSVDAVSDEILLRYHYRCHPKIIAFNNRKYYNSKLEIRTRAGSEETDQPLRFIDCRAYGLERKNTCESEVLEIIDYIRRHPEEDIGVITPFANQRDLIRRVFREEGIRDVSNGTVHAFQGDERQVILFSLALSARTGPGTYGWLRNNRELINVATSRARQKLIMIGDSRQLQRLHRDAEGMDSGMVPMEESPAAGRLGTTAFGRDDLYELYEYICSNGESQVSEIEPGSRALGIKPYEQKTEDELLENLNHALRALPLSTDQCRIQTRIPALEVLTRAIAAEAGGAAPHAEAGGSAAPRAGADEAGAQTGCRGGADHGAASHAGVDEAGTSNGGKVARTPQTAVSRGYAVPDPGAVFGGYKASQMQALARDLFYQKTFDYVVYEGSGEEEIPIFAIEVLGLDFDRDDVTVQRRDRFLDLLRFQCISVPSNYARRYQYLKDILTDYFEQTRR